MTLGWSVVRKIVCIACARPIDEHSFKELGRCLFRIQGTYVHENFKKKSENSETSKEPNATEPSELQDK